MSIGIVDSLGNVLFPNGRYVKNGDCQVSNYRAPARHPVTGNVELAEWLDDHFGRHQYGVRFADGHVFHEGQIDECVCLSLGEYLRNKPPSDTFTPYHEWSDGFDRLAIYFKEGRTYSESHGDNLWLIRDADTGELVGVVLFGVERFKKEG